MSHHVIKMPDLGEGIAEVELVAWHVKVGDAVAEDQVLADVMTDKATVEIPSPVAGTVASLGGDVGEVLAVGAELISIETDAVAVDDSDSDGKSPGNASTPAAGKQAASGLALAAANQAGTSPSPSPSPTPTPTPTPATATPPTKATRKAAATDSSAQHPASQKSTAPATRAIASPAVRARAWELGIDLNDVDTSGTAGRVMQADLDAHVERGGPRRAAPSQADAAPSRRAPSTPGATEQIKIIGLRRRIAQKMQDSKRRIPHYAYVEEVDVTELEALRAQLNQRFGAQRGRLTLLPLLIRAMVLAIPEFPMLNAWFDDEAGVLTQHQSVHMGVATQTDAGLMVPVLRDAQDGDLWSNAAEIVRLADAARSGKAVRDELTGSTITLTSLGKLGGIVSTPVINSPEVAIVGVNKMVERPVVRDGVIVVRQMMNLSSSFDHRVVDGAKAAAFIQRIRETLEHPALLFVE